MTTGTARFWPRDKRKQETSIMNAPATPKTLAEQVAARRDELKALIEDLDSEIDRLKDSKANARAELDALPVARARRTRQPKP